MYELYHMGIKDTKVKLNEEVPFWLWEAIFNQVHMRKNWTKKEASTHAG